MRTREVLAGGLVRDIWFMNEDEFQKYYVAIALWALVLQSGSWAGDGPDLGAIFAERLFTQIWRLL